MTKQQIKGHRTEKKKIQAGDFNIDARYQSTDEAKSLALLFVCGRSENAEEANTFIDMLGLRETLKDNYQGAG